MLPRRLVQRIACAGLLGYVAAVGFAPAASAAGVAAPAPGTNRLVDGTLDQPGTEGANPTGWTLVNLDAETSPYKANLGQYDANGQYAPPTPVPNHSGYTSEAFYEAGSAAGTEGIGGQQTASSFGTVTQADNPQISFSTAQTSAPDPSVVAWAGSVLQVVVTSGAQTDTLRYFDPFTSPNTPYTGAPAGSATIRYITGPTLSDDTWTTNPTRSLSADLTGAFGISSYTVTSVTYGDLEGTTSSGGGGVYPNETSYWTNVALAEGSGPAPALPESPEIVELPLAAIGLAGGMLLWRRVKARRVER